MFVEQFRYIKGGLTMVTVRVGFPSFRQSVSCPNCGKKGVIPAQTAAMLQDLQSCKEINFQVVTVTGTHCMRGRNVSSQAKPQDAVAPIKQILPYDYYLATDDDMAFTSDTIGQLIEHNKDIIGASYMVRSGSDAHLIVACPIGKRAKADWFKVWDRGIQECDWTGGGCLLIKKNVFEAMEYPWFRNNVVREEVNGVLVGDIQTEDLSFCQDARRAGFKVYIDLDVRAAHIPT